MVGEVLAGGVAAGPATLTVVGAGGVSHAEDVVVVVVGDGAVGLGLTGAVVVAEIVRGTVLVITTVPDRSGRRTGGALLAADTAQVWDVGVGGVTD